ncbi:VPLPA-CTERM sorting domain-containing protein [Roseobacter sp. MH60115]|uniref:VPLPA-CTERM sorting domain-containing protein n=1 Tax=Roseobacter sp. MH60115 TaxID=2785324 RepID=UPI0018A2E89A|nr:VPLPA-CTERM sorting domain-containing protein [Roseobacter sp. MH60115]
MNLLRITLFCALTAAALPAHATTVTLDLRREAVPDFRDRYVNNGDSVSAGGFVLTFQDVNIKSTSTGSASRSGMSFNNFFDNTIITLDVVFNIDTIIDTYDIGFTRNAGDKTFQLSGVNGTSGANSFGSRGMNKFDMGSIPFFKAGETYTFSHNVNGFSQHSLLSGLGVSAAPSPAVVPLPASLPLLLVGFGAIGFLRRRRT